MTVVGLKLKEVIQSLIFSENDGESRGCSEMMAMSNCRRANPKRRHLRRVGFGTSPVAQWLRLHTSTAQGTGLIPGQGIKILHAAHTTKRKGQGFYKGRNGLDIARGSL